MFATAACLAWLLMQPVTVRACAACYGESGSPMSKGLTWAITAMIGIVGCVLTGVVVFFVHTVKNTPPAPGEEKPAKDI